MPRLKLTLLFLLTMLVVLPTTPAVAGGAAPDELDRSRVDAFVDDYLDRNGLPGATVAVVKDGEVVLETGFGHDSDGRPLDEHSRLRLGSVSKSFTAFAVLQLVDEGEVDLDEPVATYLPDLEMTDERAARITVRQLLSHTSGIPSPTIVGPADTLAQGADRVRGWALTGEPGTSYLYSNANYWLAARLVEVVSGRPFPEVLQSEVFEPLGMDDSETVTTTRDPVSDLAAGHVTAYGRAFASREPTQLVSGSGGVVSTAADMAAWLAMQQRGGTTVDGERLLSADLVRDSHAPQPAAGRWGLGWARSTSRSPERVSTSGLLGTFNAQQDLVPSSGYGVVVLLNSFTATREHAYAISTGIIALTEGDDPEVGAPVPTLVDLGLGALTLLAVGLGVLGLRRGRTWAARRAGWPRWRYAVRLVPQLVLPALAVFVLVVAPALQDNSLTTADAFRLFPALMVLLTASAAVGLAVTTARVRARWVSQRSGAGEQPARGTIG